MIYNLWYLLNKKKNEVFFNLSQQIYTNTFKKSSSDACCAL